MGLQQRLSLSLWAPLIKRYLCLFGLPILVFILSGCAYHPAARQRSIDYSTAQWPKSAILSDTVLSIDFLGACRMAARQSEPLLKRLMQKDLHAYDIEQARSEIWPRLDLQAIGQIPLGGGDGDRDNHVRGGLYIRYDFHKALFSGDAAAAARAQEDKQFEKAKGQIAEVAYHLLGRLIDLSTLEEQQTVSQNMVAQAENGLTTAKKLYELRLQDASVVRKWDGFRHLHQQKLQNIQHHLSQTRSDFRLALGLHPLQKVIVEDRNHIISNLAKPINAAPDDPQFFTALLNRLPEGRVAIHDLFLSEMAIVNAKRQRLPRFSGSLGLGRFDAFADDDEASPGTLDLILSMPFVDWGDIRRDVNKAERQKKWAQRQIQLLAHRLHHGIVAGQNDWQHTQTVSQQTKQMWQTMHAQAQENEQLLSINRIQTLDAIQFQLETFSAQIEYLQSIRDFYRSAANLNKKLGISLVDDLGPLMKPAGKPDAF